MRRPNCIGNTPRRPNRIARTAAALFVWSGLTFSPADASIVSASSAQDSPIADAAQHRDVTVVRALLADGADPNAAQGDGMTGLHWAARYGHVEMARLLIDAGGDVSAVTRLGAYTPLHLASQYEGSDVAEALLQAGSDPHAVTTTGAQPIHFAAASGNAGTVAALLDHGADIDAREVMWGQTPLMFASAGNRSAGIRLLLEHGADATITARVVDIAAREEEDRAAQRRRTQQLDAAARERTPADAGPDRYAAAPERTRPSPGRTPTEVLTPEQRLLGTTEIDPLSYADLVGTHGGLTALLLAVREGHVEAAMALLDGGGDVNRVSAADNTTPLVLATINGHFDLAKMLFDRGADPTIASDAGATPLYAALNTEWGPKSRHPQPTDYMQQATSYIELMRIFLEAGADPNVRLKKQLWYTTYNNDLLRVDRTGATPFWRAAYALDISAMELLFSYGADPTIPTIKMRERRFRRGPAQRREDLSGLAPVPVGGPGVHPIHAASGAGYGQGYAANSHRHIPDGWVPAVKYLVEVHGADVNARDLNGYSPVHHAAARGDNDLIRYLVEQGAEVTFVSRRGQTTVDMANGPYQRVQPYPETISLLERLGAKNNHNCVSCE